MHYKFKRHIDQDWLERAYRTAAFKSHKALYYKMFYMNRAHPVRGFTKRQWALLRRLDLIEEKSRRKHAWTLLLPK